jgi:tetratricopeptide (TPR) repeat protein
MTPYQLIEELSEKEQYTAADVARVEALLKKYPKSAELWEYFGDLMQMSDDEYPVERSQECYEKAIQCYPSFATAHESLGHLYDAYLDDFPKAEKSFLKAIEFGAGDSARIGLARVLAQTDREAEALKMLDQCEDQASADLAELRAEIEEAQEASGGEARED